MMWKELLYLVLLDLFSISLGAPPPVYVSNGTHIVSYSKVGPSINAIYGQSNYRIVGLAVDLSRNLMFWSDISTDYRGIYRSDLQGNGAVKIIDDVGEINGITVDWVSAHLYWTDLERKTIEVADYDGVSRRVLIADDLKSPRAIVAAPLFGFLFWADQRNKRIERAWLDGTHRRTLVKSADYFPNQLAVSFKREMLFWVDANKHSVFSCNLGGKNVKQQVDYSKIAQGAPGFGLVVFGNTALISTWFNTALYVLLLDSRKLIWQQEAEGLGTRELFNIVSLNPDTQPMMYHACMEQEKGGCSHLCLPTNKETFTCACPTYGALTMSSDDKTCTLPKEILLCTMEDRGGVGFVSLGAGQAREITMISKSTSPRAVTYDKQQNLVFWSDVSERVIYRSRLDGSEKTKYVDESVGIGVVTSLYYHDDTSSLYFINTVGEADMTSEGGTYSTLERIDTHTGGRTTLLRNLRDPVGFAFDDENRYIYILQGGGYNNPTIVRTELDALQAYTLPIDITNPIGFVVNGNRLTVAEKFKDDTVLTEIDMDTINTVSTQVAGKTIGGMTSINNDLFLVEKDAGELLFLNHSTPTVLLSNVHMADVMYTITSAPIPEEAVDVCVSQGCSCIPLPRYSSGGTRRCMCRGNLFEVATTERNSCKRPENFVLFADANTIQLLSLDPGTVETPSVVHYGSRHSVFTSLLYDDVKERIFWIDEASASIYMSRMHQLEPMLVYRDEGPITSMVLDAGRQRLYWTGVMRGSLWFIASLNLNRGLQSYKHVYTTENELSALTLNLDKRWLFFAEEDSDGTVISLCKTSGHRHRVIVKHGIISPVGIVVTKDAMFVAEKSGGIIKLKDTKIEDIYAVSDHISGLAVHGSLLIYTSRDGMGEFDTRTRRQGGMLASDLRAPGALVVHHPAPREEACASRPEGACDGVCGELIRGRSICGCNEPLQELDSDGRTCIHVTTTTTTTPTPVTTTTTTPTTTTTKKPTTILPKVLDDEEGEQLVHFIDEHVHKQTTETPVPEDDVTTERQSEKTTESNEFAWNEDDDSKSTDKFYDDDDDEDEFDKDDTDDVSTVTSSPVHETSSSSGHSGEPRPTTSTQTYESYDGLTTEGQQEHYGFVRTNEEGRQVDKADLPYFEGCPENDTIIVRAPEDSRQVRVPVRPSGYARDGTPLPLHCNYELTDDGILVSWEGMDAVSHHDVIFNVTSSERHTGTCSFRLILEDLDAPRFTVCPDNKKVSTSQTREHVEWLLPEVNDNVGIKHFTSSHDSGAEFELGETLVNYTVVDFSGNKAQCVFTVFVAHDELCQVSGIPHGGILCEDGGEGKCKVTCQTGYAVNPIRVFRRSFHCKQQGDADALRKALEHQDACLKHDYPSVLTQEYRSQFTGPISKHKEEVKANLQMAISGHLSDVDLCNGERCHVDDSADVTCEAFTPSMTNYNVSTCVDLDSTMDFFFKFNITLKNNTVPVDDDNTGNDVIKMEESIYRELKRFGNMLRVEFGEHVYTPRPDSLERSVAPEQRVWLCPRGQVSEDNICISCPPGTFHNTTLDTCEYCIMGHYQDNPGQVTCLSCPPGHTSPDGAIKSEQCTAIPSMDEMTLFIIVTTCSFGVVFLCMAITLYMQFKRQHKRNQQAANQKKTRYNMTPNLYVAPPPILKSKLDENFTHGEKTYSIDRKHPINIFANHEYNDDVCTSKSTGSLYHNEVYNMLHGQLTNTYSPGDEVPTGTLSRENTFSNPTYSPQFGIRRNGGGSLQRSMHTASPGPQRKMSQDSTFSNQSPRLYGSIRTPTSDTPLITQSPLLRMKLAAYNLNQED